MKTINKFYIYLITNDVNDKVYVGQTTKPIQERFIEHCSSPSKLGKAIQLGEVDLGIAICGTGIGMSISLNKMKGVYCAKVSSVSEATLSKAHNNANVIALSEELSDDVMLEIIQKFIDTPFSNVSKYIRRNNMIKELEND